MLPTDSSDQRSRFLFVSTDTLPYYTPPPNYPTPNHPSRRRDSRRDAAILDDDDQAQAQPLEDRVQDASSPQDQESYYPTSAALSATSRRHSTPVTSSPLARVHRPSQSLPSAILNPGHPNQAQTGKGASVQLNPYIIRPTMIYDFLLCPLQSETGTPFSSPSSTPLQIPPQLLASIATQPPVPQLYVTFPLRSHIAIAQNAAGLGVTVGDVLNAIAGYLCRPMSRQEKIKLLEAIWRFEAEGDTRHGAPPGSHYPSYSISTSTRQLRGSHHESGHSGSGSPPESPSANSASGSAPSSSGYGSFSPLNLSQADAITPDSAFLLASGLTRSEVTQCVHPIELYGSRGRTIFGGLVPVGNYGREVLWMVKLSKNR